MALIMMVITWHN